MAIDNNKITISSSSIDVLLQNPGLNLTLSDASRVRIEGGCIRFLRYGSNSEDLDYVLFKNGDRLMSSQTVNLKDFRESFKCAAQSGMAVTYCITKDRKKLSMINLYPCLCSCDSKKYKNMKARDVLTLSGS